LTLTFDPAIRHVVLHQSSTSSYIPNFIQIEETFCGRTDVRTYGWTDIFPLYIIRSTLGSRPNKQQNQATSSVTVYNYVLTTVILNICWVKHIEKFNFHIQTNDNAMWKCNMKTTVHAYKCIISYKFIFLFRNWKLSKCDIKMIMSTNTQR